MRFMYIQTLEKIVENAKKLKKERKWEEKQTDNIVDTLAKLFKLLSCIRY